MKILAIDDNAVLMDGVNSFFKKKGEARVVAECCRSFAEAIMAIGRHHPTVILLDDDLGKPRDGLEIAKHLREHNSSRYEIVSITGTGDQDILAEYAELGIPILEKGGRSIIQWIKERLAQDPK